jgi:hypothetical protein
MRVRKHLRKNCRKSTHEVFKVAGAIGEPKRKRLLRSFGHSYEENIEIDLKK